MNWPELAKEQQSGEEQKGWQQSDQYESTYGLNGVIASTSKVQIICIISL
jgi:hypothetical protein